MGKIQSTDIVCNHVAVYIVLVVIRGSGDMYWNKHLEESFVFVSSQYCVIITMNTFQDEAYEFIHDIHST